MSAGDGFRRGKLQVAISIIEELERHFGYEAGRVTSSLANGCCKTLSKTAEENHRILQKVFKLLEKVDNNLVQSSQPKRKKS